MAREILSRDSYSNDSINTYFIGAKDITSHKLDRLIKDIKEIKSHYRMRFI